MIPTAAWPCPFQTPHTHTKICLCVLARWGPCGRVGVLGCFGCGWVPMTREVKAFNECFIFRAGSLTRQWQSTATFVPCCTFERGSTKRKCQSRSWMGFPYGWEAASWNGMRTFPVLAFCNSNKGTETKSVNVEWLPSVWQTQSQMSQMRFV